MKIPLRVSIPLGLACVVAVLIGGFLLWQINASVRSIESAFQGRQDHSILGKLFPRNGRATMPRISQSEALMSLRQGEIFELRGEWKQAEEKYRASAESGGGSPALRKLASIELQRREYDNARQSIAALKDADAGSDDVLLLEGLLALRTGDRAEALAIFKRRGNTPQGLYGLSIAAIAAGDHENARATLTQAAVSGDATIQAYAKTILDAYDQFALFPEGQDIHRDTLLARALAEVNECETSLLLSTAVVGKQSRYRDAWIVKGYCEFRSERLKDALTSLEVAYTLDPGKAETQYFLARAHAALGDPQNAVTYLQYAIQNGFEPETDARSLLADYAQELGNTDLALEELKALAEAKDSTIDAFERYIDLAISIPNHGPDALAVATIATTRWPDDADALALAAKAALAAGLPADAEKYVNASLKIDPKNAAALAVEEALKKNGGK